MSNIDNLCKLVWALGSRDGVQVQHNVSQVMITLPAQLAPCKLEFAGGSVECAAGLAINELHEGAIGSACGMRERSDAIYEALGAATTETIVRELLARAASEHDRVVALLNKWKDRTSNCSSYPTLTASIVVGCARELESALDS